LPTLPISDGDLAGDIVQPGSALALGMDMVTVIMVMAMEDVAGGVRAIITRRAGEDIMVQGRTGFTEIIFMSTIICM
jgi:hypothetical protein